MNMKKNIIRWYHTKDVVSRTLIVKFLKSIKIDIPTFNGRHDPQLFLIGLNNLTSTSRGTISLSPEKLSLQR